MAEHPHLVKLREAMSYGISVPDRVRLADLDAAKTSRATARALRLIEASGDADDFRAALNGDYGRSL